MSTQLQKTAFQTLLLAFGLLLVASAAGAQGFSDNRAAAYTAWAVVFNQPENCTDPCNQDDVDNPVPSATALLYLSGQRVPRNGRISLGGALGENATVGSLPLPTRALLDADAAEVHVILRTHGRFVGDLGDEQIISFDGACDVQSCTNEQFAIFRPGEGDVQRVEVRRFPDAEVVENAWATLYRGDDGIRVAIHSRLP